MLRDLDQMEAMTDGVLSFLRDGEPREAATRINLGSSLQSICDQFADLCHLTLLDRVPHGLIARITLPPAALAPAAAA